MNSAPAFIDGHQNRIIISYICSLHHRSFLFTLRPLPSVIVEKAVRPFSRARRFPSVRTALRKDQAVAAALLCQKVAWILGVSLKLFAQPVYGRVKAANLAEVCLVVPLPEDFFDELLAGA